MNEKTSLLKRWLVEVGVSEKGADATEKAVARVEQSTKQLERGGSSALQSFERRAGQAFDGVVGASKRSWKGIVDGLRGIKDDVGKLDLMPKLTVDAFTLAAKAKEAIMSIPNAIQDATARADRIAKQADFYGLSTDEFQRLDQIAQHSGATVEKVGDAVLDLSKRLRDEEVAFQRAVDAGTELAKIPLGPTQTAFKEIGVSLDDFASASVTQRLAMVSDGLRGIEDDGRRAALRMTILGGSGKELGALMKAGGDAIRDMSAAAEGVIPEESLRRAEAFNDRMQDSKARLDAVKTEILIEAAPALAEITVSMHDLVAENQEFLKQELPQYVSAIGQAMIDAARATKSLIDRIRDVGSSLEDSRLNDFILGMQGVARDAVTGRRVRFTSEQERQEITTATIDPQTGERISVRNLRRMLDVQLAAATGPGSDYEAVATTGAGFVRDEKGDLRAVSEVSPRETFEALKKSIDGLGDRLEKSQAGILVDTVAGMFSREATTTEAPAEAPKPKRGGAKPKVKEDDEVSLTSFEQLLASTLGPGFELSKLAAVRKVDADRVIEPKSVVNITNNNVTQHNAFTIAEVRSADATAQAVATRLERLEIRNEAKATANNRAGVKR